MTLLSWRRSRAMAASVLGAKRDAGVVSRGNLRTRHTIDSYGDSPPYDVMAWYKRNGYQFLVLTDHNTFTDPALFDTNPNDNFLLNRRAKKSQTR